MRFRKNFRTDALAVAEPDRWDCAMQDFIARQNIERFSKLIEREPDPAQRQRLELMLAAEKAKLHSGGAVPTEAGSAPSDHPAAEHRSQVAAPLSGADRRGRSTTDR